MKTNSPNPFSSVADGVSCKAWQLLAVVLGVAVQACGGAGGPSVVNSNVSLELKDAGPDLGAMDPPSNLPDAAVDQEIATLDNATDANPVVGAPDAMPMDTGDDLSPASFSCGSLDGSLDTLDPGPAQRICCDFANSSCGADFNSEAGTWVISNGSYNASGPPSQVTCPGGAFGGSGMSASVLSNFSTPDVRVHAKMTSVKGPDKVLVLRSRPGGNRIELNFVANYTYDGEALGGFLNISELVGCVNATYLAVGAGSYSAPIPHAIGQAIVVDVQLIGSHLTVLVDAKEVFDDILEISNAAGSVGFAVFRDAETQFNDLVVEVLQ